jgi:hypothetical protein
MAIFNSYVKLPEGQFLYGWLAISLRQAANKIQRHDGQSRSKQFHRDQLRHFSAARLLSVRLCALASIDPVQRAEQKSECYAIMQGADI